MSGLDPSIVEAILQEYPILTISNRAFVASVALWMYDYAITLSDEVNFIWPNAATLPGVLFLINRYFFMISWGLEVVTTFVNTSDESCAQWVRSTDVLAFVASGIAMAIFALRTFVIYERSWSILAFLGIIGVARTVCRALRDLVYNQPGSSEPIFPGCGVSPIDPLFTRFDEANNFLILGFDTLVFLLTVAKTVKQVRTIHQLGIKQGLSYHLLRDGTIYYLPLVLCTIAEVCSDMIADSANFSDIISPFVTVLQNVLVNRLVLSLRQVDKNTPGNSTFSSSVAHGAAAEGTFAFAANSILGNIGASLAMDDHDEYDTPCIKTEEVG